MNESISDVALKYNYRFCYDCRSINIFEAEEILFPCEVCGKDTVPFFFRNHLVGLVIVWQEKEV
jgi:hypothetical protein